MLKTVTTLIQLVIFTVQATVNNEILIRTWMVKDFATLQDVTFVSFPNIATIIDPKVDSKNYVKDNFEPALKDCTNSISEVIFDADYKPIEHFPIVFFNSEKVIEILENNPTFQPEMNDIQKEALTAIVSAGEIYKLLLEKKVIPTVKIGNDVMVSLNEMIRYMLQSLCLLCGEKKFTQSEEIKTAVKKIEEIRKNLNAILEKFYDNGTFKKNTNTNFSTTKLTKMSTEIRDQWKSLNQFLNDVNFNGNDQNIWERRYLAFHNTLEIIGAMLFSMIDYAYLLTQSGNWSEFNAFGNFLLCFQTIARRLVIFAVPKSKIQKFISALKKENGECPFGFSIFDQVDGDFNNDWSAVEKVIKESTKDNTIFFLIIAGISFLLLLAAGILIYYVKHKYFQ